MANLPRGALRGVRKAMRAQGITPKKEVKEGYASKSVQQTGDKPTRVRSYNVKVNDLVEYRPYDHSHVLMDWQIGQVVGIYINEAFIRDGRFDLAATEPLLRLGYMDYASVGPAQIFEMNRPMASDDGLSAVVPAAGWDGVYR